MKLILSGWPGSKKVLAASLYLIDKYLGDIFDVICIRNDGDIGNWSKSVSDYLKQIDDELIILGMDDMLINASIDIKKYNKLLNYISMGDNIICAKLCTSDFHKPTEYEMLDDETIVLNNTAEFSSVGQYCIWDREFLIWLLEQTTDAWNFEGAGSKILNKSGKKVIGTKIPTIFYNDRSAMSRNWPGKIKVVGSPKEDIDELLKLGLLKEEDLLYE